MRFSGKKNFLELKTFAIVKKYEHRSERSKKLQSVR